MRDEAEASLCKYLEEEVAKEEVEEPKPATKPAKPRGKAKSINVSEGTGASDVS